MTRTIEVCPECDEGATVRVVRPDHPREQYRCKSCNARFRHPNEREMKRPNHSGAGTGSELAARLANADPDEVSR